MQRMFNYETMKKLIIYFSPTKNSEKIALKLAEIISIKAIDITLPKNRVSLNLKDTELLFIVLSVHGQNIPSVLKDYFKNLQYHGKLVLIGTYGSIKAGGVLNYLEKYLHGKVLAKALFPCEHSYLELSNQAVSPKNTEYLYKLVALTNRRLEESKDIISKDKSNLFSRLFPKLILRLSSKLPNINENCIRCNKCISECPAAAIKEDLSIEKKICLHCFRCVLVCESNARMKKLSKTTSWYLKRYIDEEKLPTLY